VKHTKKLAINTTYQYIRILITMFVSLYSVRLLLEALGVTDYGIYNLIAGVIMMISFLNGAMSASSLKYFSHSIGKNDKEQLSMVFRTSQILHLIIAVIIFGLFEIIGLLIFNGALNIPQNRIFASQIVYQSMVISLVISISTVPFDTIIVAHENFLIDSIFGTIEPLSKLLIAIMLLKYNNDRLILYAILYSSSIIIIKIVKIIYCLRVYSVIRTKIKSLKVNLLKEMAFFAGWNTFGALCGVARSRGIDLIINIFYGVTVNAAYAISFQIDAKLKDFSISLMKVFRPQIIKYESLGERNEMLYLSMMASKFSSFLMIIFTIPLYYEMNFVLKIWLNDVPEFTLIFSRLIILLSFIKMLTVGLQVAIQAYGDIKHYQMIVGTTILFTLPFSWIVLFMGYPVYTSLIVAIVIELIASIERIIIINKKTKMSISEYLKKVYLKVMVVSLPSILILFFIDSFMSEGFLRLTVTITSTFIISITMIFYFGISMNDRFRLTKYVKNALQERKEKRIKL